MGIPLRNTQSLSVAVATLVLSAMGLEAAVAADSTAAPPELRVAARPSNSIIGSASNEMTCRYLSADGKIHCVYGGSTATEYVAESRVEPDFPQFGTVEEGLFDHVPDADFAFAHGETETHTIGNDYSTHCRLALKFKTTTGQKFWIWHEELRHGPDGQRALVDADADGIADLSVSGRWTGEINGTMRWRTADPFDPGHPESLRRYPARPEFGVEDGRSRGCRPEDARLTILGDANSNTVGEVGGDWIELLGVDVSN